MTTVCTPTMIASCIVRSLTLAFNQQTTHQCVMSMLSGPDSMTRAPPGPASLESKLCAHVSVMCGRS